MSAIPSSNHVPPAPSDAGATEMSFPNPPLPTLPIVSADVPRQFARRGDLSEAQFLYGEVARRMLGRLQHPARRGRGMWRGRQPAAAA